MRSNNIAAIQQIMRLTARQSGEYPIAGIPDSRFKYLYNLELFLWLLPDFNFVRLVFVFSKILSPLCAALQINRKAIH